MKTVTTIAAVRAWRREAGSDVGFVPTMGYLHAGHVSLVERARRENAQVAASVFVNPAQFGPTEDLARYPRDLPRDLELCEQGGVDLVFTPSNHDIYQPGHRTYVEVHDLQDLWEGNLRPGHFRGVATVVALLFRIIEPAKAYFGEKDYQQLQIVRRLAADLRLGVEIVGCPTVREPDGLACSSRNVYLDPPARAQAAALYAALVQAQACLAQGEHRADALCGAMREVIARTPQIELDYAAVVDPECLAPLDTVTAEARALISARLAGVHLIDNAPLVPVPAPSPPGRGLG